MRLRKVFLVFFALAERLPTSATLAYTLIHTLLLSLDELLNIVPAPSCVKIYYSRCHIATVPCVYLYPHATYRKAGQAGGGRSSQLLIYWSRWSTYDLERSVDLRWLFDHWCYIHLRWSCLTVTSCLEEHLAAWKIIVDIQQCKFILAAWAQINGAISSEYSPHGALLASGQIKE